MNEIRNFPNKSELDEIADDSGLAIAVVDAASREVSVSNDTSVCRSLNPGGQFSTACSLFCGKALENVTAAGKTISFECHAGLECRAVLIGSADAPLAAIVGRTFVKAENYRKATERAISGDWREYAPSQLFENVLLTGSLSVLDKAAKRIERLVAAPPIAESAPQTGPLIETASKTPSYEAIYREVERSKQRDRTVNKPKEEVSTLVKRFNREVGLEPNIVRPVLEPEPQPAAKPQVISPPEADRATVSRPLTETTPEATPESGPATVSNENRTAEARAWRSFFGSLLKTDYPKAAESILEFLGVQFNFSSLLWLEKKENRLENAAAYGEMKSRKVRLGIAADDPRLIEASRNDRPLELGERSKDPAAADARRMHLFPIGVGGEISAAIAILDPLDDENVKNQIARICHSIAPQLEILRLRGEIAQGETLSLAVKKFSESLKKIDSDDLLINLTQNAAEMLRAERASLMIYDDKSEALEIKAIVGAIGFKPNGVVGDRVAKIVFGRKAPVIVADVTTTGLPPAPPDRQYKTASFMSSPIFVGGRTIGVMNFADKASGLPFDRQSLELFQAIAPHLAVAVDRATLKEKAGEFEQLSVTDALTGLLNRRYIEQRLMEEIKRSNRHGFPMSFMMLDVDHFKTYNDQFGHPAGDEALKLVGHVIRETLRGADVAARFGGEEFSILLPQTTADEAAAIAERIRTNIEEAKFQHRKVTISIGIASCSAELCSSSNIVSAADKALYEAKRRGRNTVLSFEGMPSQPLN